MSIYTLPEGAVLKNGEAPCECWSPCFRAALPLEGVQLYSCNACGVSLMTDELLDMKTCSYCGERTPLDAPPCWAKETEVAEYTERFHYPLPNKPDQKPRPTLVDPDFIMAMAAVMELGLKNGRNREDWKRINTAQALCEYPDALLRHVLDGVNPPLESEEDHLAAVACNAMILWWHRRRG